MCGRGTSFNAASGKCEATSMMGDPAAGASSTSTASDSGPADWSWTAASQYPGCGPWPWHDSNCVGGYRNGDGCCQYGMPAPVSSTTTPQSPYATATRRRRYYRL